MVKVGYKQTEGHRLKISQALKGKKKKPFSLEHIRNISISHKGMMPWNVGKKLHYEVWNKDKKGLYKATEETKLKQSLALSGKKKKPFTEEHKRKLGFAFKGKRHTAEWKKNKSEMMKGSKNPFWGKKHTSEANRKNREARLSRVIPTKDTSIEVKLQNWLKEQGIEFETHYPILGQPDIFIKPNICIFADGCYWHKCKECGFGEGKERDLQVTQELQRQGYTVYRIWEHDIKENNFVISL